MVTIHIETLITRGEHHITITETGIIQMDMDTTLTMALTTLITGTLIMVTIITLRIVILPNLQEDIEVVL
jgi:hypothetical protein